MAIGLIGRVDPNLVDGQTVKTRSLLAQLRTYFPNQDIVVADVSSWKSNPLRTLASVRHCMEACEDVFVLLSSNGRKVVFPLISRMNYRLHRRIYHDVVGTGPIMEAETSPKMRAILNSFSCNWVETHAGAKRLQACGVTNASYLPNFKDLQPVDVDSLPMCTHPPYRFCTFSRVVEDKGVDDAVAACAQLNRRYQDQLEGPFCSIDVYGPIDPSYEEKFRALVESNECCSYKGVRSPDQSVSILSTYDALLFPTRHPTEGIPGTVIDALFAGLPIVASRWVCYDEMLKDGVTGYSFPYGHPEELPNTILRLVGDPEALQAMRHNCVSASSTYSPNTVMSSIVAAMRAQGYPS